MELAKVEKSEELALLQVQVKGLEKTTQRAVDRAWRKETELEENERHWTAFFEILAKERVVLENALYEKDKELKKAKVKEERYDRDVQELRDRMAAMEKRDKEHLERIGDAAHTMNRKQKKITRLTASYQLAKEREMALQAELDRLKASSSTSKSAGRKPLHPLSPNSQCSDSAVPAAQDAFILTEDNSLEVVSTVDDGDLDPSMDLTAGAPRQRTHPPPPREWLAPPTKRRKLEKKQPLNDDVRSFLDPRTGKMMKGVVTGARRRVRAQPY
ncbi:hypothetical protein CALVIDRAFT_532239 [Calocera viscosa TUFC12733]|uniref:Uncharacterized protein n=1 Tax=Calocera viscosa (strain TUFC12733) TaxID=1330018 RepID=A0A167S0Y6_CALVF|nr:hypothetical protein CALVIDRAFT_532239 [Calocera viscosa TUFC12733]